jgi:hypothetical protein
MTKLYKHEKTQSRQKLGFINGTLLSDAYVIGTTRNVFLDVISFGIVGIVVLGIGIHGMMRWYFRKSTKFPASSHKVEQSKQDENNI